MHMYIYVYVYLGGVLLVSLSACRYTVRAASQFARERESQSILCTTESAKRDVARKILVLIVVSYTFRGTSFGYKLRYIYSVHVQTIVS